MSWLTTTMEYVFRPSFFLINLLVANKGGSPEWSVKVGVHAKEMGKAKSDFL